MFKPILALLAGILCFSAATAQVELRQDHPDRYVVVKGDTLWDIAEMFLNRPWLWPEIWHVNPQVENPHLIYPGDVLNLVYIDGQPRLMRSRTVKLSPTPRATPLAEAIEPINLNDIRHYLDKRTVLSGEEISNLPYVVAIEEGYLAGSEGHRVYVRGMEQAQPGESYSIVRPTVIFRELPARGDSYRPEAEEWEFPAERSITDYMVQFWDEVIRKGYNSKVRTLGYEVIQTAVAEVSVVGDPTTLLITASDLEVNPGDMLIPMFTSDYDLEYYPHSPESVPSDAQVIALSKVLFGAGPNQVVAINKGLNDGIAHGDVFSTYRPGKEIRDEVKYPRDDVKTYFSTQRRRDAQVQLPDEYTSHIMIFKSHEHISYGLIMRGQRAVRVLDVLKMP
ncbi:MAG: LysM peptidoglycan-binding domain-containing protein [Xanthomonadales bacterium]|nr:LysM peptidoglycan-binding domain-containing protein [Xanthomonadales bacterium]